MAKQKCRIQVEVEYDPKKTDPKAISNEMDRLWKTVNDLVGADTWDDYGNPVFLTFEEGEPPVADDLQIARFIQGGELNTNDCENVDDVIVQVGRLMDGSCTWDIVGSPLFQGSDGLYYTVEVQGRVLQLAETDEEALKVDFGIESDVCCNCGKTLNQDGWCTDCNKDEVTKNSK